MVRTVLALLTLTLLLPSLAADAPEPLAYERSAACRTALLPVDVTGCAVAHAGTVSAADCDAAGCTVTLTVAASGTGLPAGVLGLESSLIAGSRTPLCSAAVTPSTTGDIACSGEITFVFPIPAACRLLVVETTATSNRVVSGTIFTELRVCKDGSVTQP